MTIAPGTGRSSCRPPRRTPTAIRAPRFPRVERLEKRALLTSFVAANVQDLIAMIKQSNTAGGTNSIFLSATNTPYTLTTADNATDGANGLPVIAAGNNLTIQGDGDIIQRSASLGIPAFRLIDVAPNATLTLKNLALRNGLASGAGAAGWGGAIYSRGSLSLDTVNVLENTAQAAVAKDPVFSNDIPGDACGGGLFQSGGTATISNSIFSNNAALGSPGASSGGIGGGGTVNGGDAYGGGLYVETAGATLNNLSITFNTARGGEGPDGSANGAGNGGNAFGGGLYVAGNNTSFDSSTLSGNIAQSGRAGRSTTGVANGRHGRSSGGGLQVGSVTMTAGNLTVSGNTADNGGGLTNNGTLTLSNSTLSGNAAVCNNLNTLEAVPLGGGGIENGGGLTLTGCTVSDNSSALDAGGIWNYGTMSMTGSTVSGNAAHENRGFFNGGDFSRGGGGIENDATLTIASSTLSNNVGTDFSSGGAVANRGTLTVTGSTFVGNMVADNLGQGGGISSRGTLKLTNCTVTNNSAALGGGLTSLGQDSATVTFCTFSGNTGKLGDDAGGGIQGYAAVSVNNSIVANNTGGDLSGNYSGNHNLTGVVSLGALADNGGPTQTMALPTGSPALDAAAAVAGVTTDQRGTTRPQNVAADIGAFEKVNLAPTIASTSTAVTVAEASAATNTGTFSDDFGNANVTLTASVGVVAKGATAGTWSWSYIPADGPAGSTTVMITATDGGGLSSNTTFALTVQNVAPTASITGAPASGFSPGGQAISLGSSVTDPSSVDAAAGFTYAWTVVRNGATYASGAAATFSFTPVGDGPYLVSLIATDKDGGKSLAAQTSIAVDHLSPLVLAHGTYGRTYLQSLSVSKAPSPGPFTFAVTGGVLPTGLSLATDGTLSGIPTASAFNSRSFTFTVAASNSSGFTTQHAYTVVIDRAPTASSVVSSLNPSTVGQSVTFTATISRVASDTSLPPPTGLLDFWDGFNYLGTQTLDDKGQAQLSISTLGVGDHQIYVDYSGDSNHLPSDDLGANPFILVQTVRASKANVSASVGVAWGASGAATLVTNADGVRLAPSGRGTLPWLNVNRITITLDATGTLTAGDVSVVGANGASYGPVTVSGSGKNYTLTLARPIAAADRVTLSIASGDIAAFTRRLDVLPGDINDDGVVSSSDLLLVQRSMSTSYNVLADLDGSGAVDITDFNLLRPLLGRRLP